ncbi:MAG: transposase [Candidatus Velamenicoccus archaeovorus]
MRTTKFIVGEYYHIYNRGTDKRDVFLDCSDYRRFLISLSELNQKGEVLNLCRRSLMEARLQSKETGLSQLVDITCFCLMPNHFHLILQQLAEGGVPVFMHKLGTSYTKYFNKKYDRSGVLFQGAYKAKRIENETYLLHLSRYIHLNPEASIKSSKDSFVDWCALKNYPWSSLRAYLSGRKRSIISDQFQTVIEHEDFVKASADSFILGDLQFD